MLNGHRERERQTLKDRLAISIDEPSLRHAEPPITIGASILFFSISLCRTSVSIICSAIQECDFYRFWFGIIANAAKTHDSFFIFLYISGSLFKIQKYIIISVSS